MRDILNKAAQQATAGQGALGVQPEAKPEVSPLKPGEALEGQRKQGGHEDLTDRMRQAAQRRVELARLEVERRQEEVKFQQQRLSEAALHDLPQGEVSADINEAQQRLNEAQSDLARAEEAQFNTELAANQKLAPSELKQGPMQKLPDGPKQGEDAVAKPSVRDQLKSFFTRKEMGQGNAEAVSVPKPKL